MVDCRVCDDHIAVGVLVEVDERLAILSSSALCFLSSLLESRIVRLGGRSGVEVGVRVRDGSIGARCVVEVRLFDHCRCSDCGALAKEGL